MTMIYKKISVENLLHVINIGIFVSCIGFLAISIWNNYYWRADFTAFYTGGALIKDSRGSQMYDLELQTTYQKEILQEGSFKDDVLPFNYPPYVAILFVPFSYLSLKTAYYLWLLFQIILIGILIRSLIKISGSWEPIEREYLIVVSLAVPYLLVTLLLGAFSLLMLIGIIQFYLTFKSGRYILAGLWFCVLALKPQILVVPLIIVLGSKQWKTLIISMVTGLFLFTSTGILLGWNTWLDFLERLTISSTYFDRFGIYPNTMHNIKGMLTTILGGNHANLINSISFTAFILMIGSVILLWRSNVEPNSSKFDLKFSLSLTLGILFSPHLNPQDSLLLIAPVAVFLNFQNFLNSEHRLFLLFMLSIPLISWLSDFWIKDSLYVRPTILLTIFLVLWIFQSYYKMNKLSNQRLKNI